MTYIACQLLNSAIRDIHLISVLRTGRRKAVVLKYQPFEGPQKRLTLISKASLKLRNTGGEEHALALNLDVGLVLSKAAGGDGGRLRLTYSTIKMSLIVDGKLIKGDDQLKKIIKDLRFVSADLTADSRGGLTGTKIHLAKVSPKGQALWGDITEQVVQSLEVLWVPLPGTTAEPLFSWPGQRRVLVGPLGLAVAAEADMTYKYLGQRAVKGRTEAVLAIRGALRGHRTEGPDVRGKGTGSAIVDVATGQIVAANLTLLVDLDLVFEGRQTKANGTLAVQLKRAAQSK